MGLFAATPASLRQVEYEMVTRLPRGQYVSDPTPASPQDRQLEAHPLWPPDEWSA